MLNMSLHASRDRELSPSQGGLLHPGVLGSVRKFSFMVILALSSVPAGSPAPLGRAGPEGQLRSPGRGSLDEVVGSERCEQRLVPLGLHCYGLPGQGFPKL